MVRNAWFSLGLGLKTMLMAILGYGHLGIVTRLKK